MKVYRQVGSERNKMLKNMITQDAVLYILEEN